MLNHLHFIGSAPDLIGVIRDMKKFLSKELQKNIISTETGVLQLFKQDGSDGKSEPTFNIWQPDNRPESISTENFFHQKVNYIHQNPCQPNW